MSHTGQSLRGWARRIRCEQHGAVATEYAVLLGLVIVVVVASVSVLGGHVDKTTRSLSRNIAAESGMSFVSYTDASSVN